MSSSPLIPREKLSAYQRWEMHSFDMPGGYNPPPPAADAADDRAEELESTRRAAYESGRAEGLREGVQQARADVQRLQTLYDAFVQQSRDLQQNLADELLKLSLELARQMVRRSLAIHPEFIIPLLNDALAQVAHASARLRITLHPADAALMREHFGAQIAAGNWQLIEDASLLRGGCLLQTDTTHLDATLQTRWQRLVASLGMEDGWIE